MTVVITPMMGIGIGIGLVVVALVLEVVVLRSLGIMRRSLERHLAEQHLPQFVAPGGLPAFNATGERLQTEKEWARSRVSSARLN